MNTLAPLFIVLAMLIVTVVLLKIGKIRHSHIVPEGYVGLLYHKGKFVRVLAPGRHVHWGRHFTIRWVDVRRASLLIAWPGSAHGRQRRSEDQPARHLPGDRPGEGRARNAELAGRSATTPLNSRCVRSSAGLPSKRCSISDSNSARNCSPACNRKPRRSASTSSLSK